MAAHINLELITSPGCHNCEAFKAFWETVKADWPQVDFKDVSVLTPEGQTLVQKHMIMSSPGLLLNGELFSTGGVNQQEFLNKLKELST